MKKVKKTLYMLVITTIISTQTVWAGPRDKSDKTTTAVNVTVKVDGNNSNSSSSTDKKSSNSSSSTSTGGGSSTTKPSSTPSTSSSKVVVTPPSGGGSGSGKSADSNSAPGTEITINDGSGGTEKVILESETFTSRNYVGQVTNQVVWGSRKYKHMVWRMTGPVSREWTTVPKEEYVTFTKVGHYVITATPYYEWETYSADRYDCYDYTNQVVDAAGNVAPYSKLGEPGYSLQTASRRDYTEDVNKVNTGKAGAENTSEMKTHVMDITLQDLNIPVVIKSTTTVINADVKVNIIQ